MNMNINIHGYNIKMDFTGMGIDGANWIRLAQDRAQWWVSVSTVMNLRVQ